LSRIGQRSFRPFASSTQATKGAIVSGKVAFVFLLEFRHEVFHESIIEIFTSQVSISVGSFDFKDSFFDGQKRNIESSTPQIKK